MVIIDFRQLAPETLHNILVEIITRQGTDYGESEIPLDVKVNQFHHNLESGKAVLMYDPKHNFIDAIPQDNLNMI